MHYSSLPSFLFQYFSILYTLVNFLFSLVISTCSFSRIIYAITCFLDTQLHFSYSISLNRMQGIVVRFNTLLSHDVFFLCVCLFFVYLRNAFVSQYLHSFKLSRSNLKILLFQLEMSFEVSLLLQVSCLALKSQCKQMRSFQCKCALFSMCTLTFVMLCYLCTYLVIASILRTFLSRPFHMPIFSQVKK